MRYILKIVVGLLAIFSANLYAVGYTLPTDGWYQLQNPSGETLCQTGDTTLCNVEPGVFILINHTTGLRDENFRISGPIFFNDCPAGISEAINTFEASTWEGGFGNLSVDRTDEPRSCSVSYFDGATGGSEFYLSSSFPFVNPQVNSIKVLFTVGLSAGGEFEIIEEVHRSLITSNQARGCAVLLGCEAFVPATP